MEQAQTNFTFRSFVSFMWQPRQAWELLACSAVLLLLGIVIHVLYPFPFVFPDTGSYVLSAKDGVFNAYRPLGYSDYLDLLHGISPSIGFIFAATYLLNALATLWMLFSCKFLLKIGNRWLFWGLCALAILAPRMLFGTNFLMSDSLFNTLTMLFITSALWICFSRNVLVLLFHLVVFALLYKVRYVGMFYVPLTVLALWFTPQPSRWVRGGLMLLPVLLFLTLYTSAKREYVRETGVDTFSAFSGWQLLNNASVLLPEAIREIKPDEFDSKTGQALHAFMQTCPDTLFNSRNMLSTACMWDKELPYKFFMFHYMQATGRPYVRAWVEMGVLYGEYARALIRKYPLRYFTRYVLPSLGSMFAPQDITEEKIIFKNEPLYKDYYGITIDAYEHGPRLFAALNPLRSAVNYIYWAVLAASLIGFAATLKRQRMQHPAGFRALLLLAAFILVYLGSSVLASPCTTWRYTMPVYLSSLVFIASQAQYLIGCWRRTEENR